MKVFIFGAGASKGSQIGFGDDHQSIAPLVNELFDDKYCDWAVRAGISKGEMADYKKEFQVAGGSLEKWLTKRYNDIMNSKSVAKKQSEQKFFGKFVYYIWWLMQNISVNTYNNSNGYNTFIKKLINNDYADGFGLINFNYDTLLDRALVENGYVLTSTFDSYISKNYIKPHGSVNWLLKMRSGDQQMDRNEYGGSLDSTSRLDLSTSQIFKETPIEIDDAVILFPKSMKINSFEAVLVDSDNHKKFYYPLILLPLSSKMYSHIKGFKEKIISGGTAMLKQATEIYLIGYRAEDDIIKEMLGFVSSGAKLHVVGMSDAEDIANNVLSWSQNLAKGEIYTEGFEKFVNSF